MDLNKKIIDAVKECPLLYKSNASIPERQCSWRKLAEEMQLQEPFLRSRWHFLREQYLREHPNAARNAAGTGSNFIYKKEMEFLQPYLRQRNINAVEEQILPDNLIEPEFIITEKDLESDGENEEYVFLEVEALGENSGEVEYGREEEQCEQLDMEQPVEVQVNDCRAEEEEEQQQQQQQQQSNANAERETEKQNEAQVIQQHEEETVKQTAAPKGPGSDTGAVKLEPVQSKSATMDANKDDNVKSTSDSKATDERCEDAIFGELVTAMLKRMPAEKKRAVKKDIMNLLLT